MTLYQINRKAAPRWSVLEEQVRRLVISNVLVPVEPDYEAAWDLATGDKFGYIGEAWQQEQDLVVLDRDDLFAIVDAALRIGGDDEQ